MRRPHFANTGNALQAPWSIAPDLDSDLAAVFTANLFTITVGGNTVAQGFRPANGVTYNLLWTRDHAQTMWHYPELLTAAQRRQFVTYYISRRTTGSEPDPDGGSLPANFIADRIGATGTAIYKNAGASDLPFMDGIAFVVLVLWADWNLTGHTATFTSERGD